MRRLLLLAVAVLGACGSSDSGSPLSASGDDASTAGDVGGLDASAPSDGAPGIDGVASTDGSANADTGGDASSGVGLSARYTCDQGLSTDPAVVWFEDFEEGAVTAVTTRYDAANNPPGMALMTDVPVSGCGQASMKLTSGVSANATDLYKELTPGHDEWFVRWYAKYQAGIQWHHTGMWIGGYNPPTPYANPQAGLKPNGDDRFEIAIEPVWGAGMPNPRLDTYDYWMQMHSWMAQPMGSTAYYGNSIIHQNAFTADDGAWMCLEMHVKLNTDLGSSTGAVFDAWKNDVLVQHFDGQSPVGCWIKDKFCPSGADGSECTQYASLCSMPYVALDMQWRSTAALQLNYFWPQNYITQGPDGSVEYDQMVVATSRVGCERKGP